MNIALLAKNGMVRLKYSRLGHSGARDPKTVLYHKGRPVKLNMAMSTNQPCSLVLFARLLFFDAAF
jgi:hypothetical protein